jgi:hypothetical protein
MNVLAIRFSGNAKQFQGFLNFCEAYGDMTVKELVERPCLLV